jgi:hypothetical protein
MLVLSTQQGTKYQRVVPVENYLTEILKLACVGADTCYMPVVTRLQRAFAGQGSDQPVVAQFTGSHDFIDFDNITFHPELMIRWDDEADDGDRTSCARPGRIGTRPAPRSATR